MKEKQFSLTIDRFLGLNENGFNEADFQPGESPRMENFEITDGYKLKKREGYSVLCTLSAPIRALWRGRLNGKDYFFAVAGVGVWKIEGESYTSVGIVNPYATPTFVSFGGSLYLGDGYRWQVYSTAGGRFTLPKYYRPLLTVATPPAGGGTFLESMNLLSGECAQRFSPDGEARDFCLSGEELLSVDYILHNGAEVSTDAYTVNLNNATVTFQSPVEEGVDNLYIAYTVRRNGQTNVDGCPFAVTFGSDNDARLFFWGNSIHPRHLWWTGVPTQGEGLYVPADCFNQIGSAEPITALTRHYDRLLIFTEKAAYYLYAEQKLDPVGNLYTSFPVFTLSVSRGNLLRGAGLLLDNHPISVCRGGLYRWVSTYQRDERNAKLFSERVQNFLLSADTAAGLYFDRESHGELWCVLGEKILIYQYRLDVFYMYSGFTPTAMLEYDGKLFFGNDEGQICAFGEAKNDGGKAIVAVWESAYLHFGYPEKKKHVEYCDLLLRAEDATEVDFTWLSDSREEGGTPISMVGGSFDFSCIDFSAFCLDTNVNTLRFRRRIGAKRLNLFKFRLNNDSPLGSLCPVSVILCGTLLCK